MPLILGCAAGIYLGALVAVASLRPFVTAEEMHAAIRALKSGQHPAGLGPWWCDVLRMWAGVLYGRPAAPTDEGAKRHVR